ncbi:MAG: methyltransferase domain-containing protein [Pseudomonadota bacterium]
MSFPYANAEYEEILCDLCSSQDFKVLNIKDRNELNVRTCICNNCGLIFINPRMTREWYIKYYQDEYREQMARFKQKPFVKSDYEADFKSAIKHGVGLFSLLNTYVKTGLTLEVGSSVGGVLNGFKDSLDLDVIGIEPSFDEATFATGKEIKTYNSLIEDFKEDIPKASNIICTQSLNHLLSPRFFLEWAYNHLEDDGRIILEVQNFRHVYRHFGHMRRAIQIDHTYMFVPETLINFVTVAGFNILFMDIDEDKNKKEIKKNKELGLPIYHIRLVGKKSDRIPFNEDLSFPDIYEKVSKSLKEAKISCLYHFLKYGLEN